MKLFSRIYRHKAFERYLARLGFVKIPSGTGRFLEGSSFGFTNVGETRQQLRAYQGHVYKCVTLIYRRAISVPMKLYKERGEYSEKIKRHPALDLLKRPNSLMTGKELKAITFMHLDLTGKAFWLKIFNRYGRPAEIWPLMVGNFEGFAFNFFKNIINGIMNLISNHLPLSLRKINN